MPAQKSQTKSGPTVGQDILTVAMNMVEAKPLALAAVSGLGGSFAYGFDFMAAFGYGAQTAVLVSAADVILTGTGVDAKLDAYVGDDYQQYIQVEDVAAGAVAGAVLAYYGGVQGQDMAYSVALSALAAGVAPLIAGKTVSALMKLGAVSSSDLKATEGVALNN